MKRVGTISDIHVAGKRVLVRVDLNSDIQSGKVVLSERITAPLVTIRELIKKRAKIVLVAHQGRPGSKDFRSLREHAQLLGKFIKIKFVNDVTGSKALSEIMTLKDGEVLLLENLRFLHDEENWNPGEWKKNRLIRLLAPCFHYYVNDAFSASHRAHTSIVGFPRVIPGVIGRLFERELKNIKKISTKDALFVLGGSKPEDNMLLASRTSNTVLATGLFGPALLGARGFDLGRENQVMKHEIAYIKSGVNKIISRTFLPVDLAVEKSGKRLDLALSEFPSNQEIKDLGVASMDLFVARIKKSRVVFMKGLVGLCDRPEFCIGTRKILEAVSQSKFSVISGGHTTTMLDRFGIPRKKFGYVSLSGGALLHYLANHNLPGLLALENNK